eukprot:gene3669-2599_t
MGEYSVFFFSRTSSSLEGERPLTFTNGWINNNNNNNNNNNLSLRIKIFTFFEKKQLKNNTTTTLMVIHIDNNILLDQRSGTPSTTLNSYFFLLDKGRLINSSSHVFKTMAHEKHTHIYYFIVNGLQVHSKRISG